MGVVAEAVPSLEDRIKRWRALGKAFGYPECCVADFVAFISDPMQSFRKPRLLDGTGFVPCQVCNTTKSEEELIAEINAKRRPDLKPFPEDEE